MNDPHARFLHEYKPLVAFVLLTLFFLSLSVATWAQEEKKQKGGKSASSRPSVSPQKGKGGGGGGSSGGGGGLTLSKQIDPAKYVLGPGDALTINLWGEYDSFEAQNVSAEGKISLPTIGDLNVSGLSLEQAEALLKRSVERYYRNVYSGLSLTALRTFKIAILGAIRTPGSYPATLDTRVSDLLDQAGGTLPGGSLRRIQVRQGEKVRAMGDLNAYLKRGVEAANPFLQDGDVIFVPPVSGSVIRVFDKAALGKASEVGEQPAVPFPLEYELEEGQKLSGLIYDLGGLNPAWDFFHVYVIRQKPDGKGTIKFNADIQKLLIDKDDAKDIILQKGDHVFFNAETQSPYLNGHGEVVGIERPYFETK